MWGPCYTSSSPDGELLYSHRRLGTRALTTVFGTVELLRVGYFRPGAPGIFPLNRALTLPARSFSYELQRRWSKPSSRILSSIRSTPCESNGPSHRESKTRDNCSGSAGTRPRPLLFRHFLAGFLERPLQPGHVSPMLLQFPQHRAMMFAVIV